MHIIVSDVIPEQTMYCRILMEEKQSQKDKDIIFPFLDFSPILLCFVSEQQKSGFFLVFYSRKVVRKQVEK